MCGLNVDTYMLGRRYTARVLLHVSAYAGKLCFVIAYIDNIHTAKLKNLSTAEEL